MCGFYVTTNNLSIECFSHKLNLIQHRGPDYKGLWEVPLMQMGHCRLAIHDLNEGGNQPFNYKDLVLVFNGEIYNFRELRDKLSTFGYQFNTDCDTEVFAAAYHYYGLEAFKKFIGMFAAVIYDKKENRLVAVRDRLGKKPLFYKYDNGHISFASTIDLLKGEEETVEEMALFEMISTKSVKGTKTILKNINRIQPAEILEYSIIRKEIQTHRYWSPLNYVCRKNTLDFHDAKVNLREILKDAVRTRLDADVPVGVMLSGGVDSSLVAGLAQESSNKKVETFSIGFHDERFDESSVAEKTANKIGTNHRTIYFSESDFDQTVNDYIQAFDEPFGDSSALAMLFLAKKMREHVTVVLTGDGADEVFLGYNRYDVVSKLNYINYLPSSLRSGLGNIAGRIGTRNSFFFRLAKYLRPQEFEESYSKLLSISGSRDLFPDVNHNEFTSYSDGQDRCASLIERAGLHDLNNYMADLINVKVDRSTMYHSIEARCPFLDHRVVEFGLSLPMKHKYGGYKKKMVRDLAKGFMLDRAHKSPKTGFTVPIGDWFRGKLADTISTELSVSNLSGIPGIDALRARKCVDDHLLSKADNRAIIWNLFCYLRWANAR